MSYPIYSTRFMQAFGDGVETTYTVPAGRRAVLRHLVARNDNGTAAFVWLRLANVWIYLHAFPVGITSVSVPLMAVAYGGEKVVLYTKTAQTAASLSGYLFSEVAGQADDPAPVTRERVLEPTLLPEGWDAVG